MLPGARGRGQYHRVGGAAGAPFIDLWDQEVRKYLGICPYK